MTMITHRSWPDPISSGPPFSSLSAEPQGAPQTLPITHIFPYQINGLCALLKVASFCAEPFEGYGSSLWLLPCYRLCLSTWEVDGMAELPRSLPEFEARFPDDAACARWLLEKRWPDGFRCPACGHDRAWELGRERLTLQCAA